MTNVQFVVYTAKMKNTMYTGTTLEKGHVGEHHMLEGCGDSCTVCLNTAAGQAHPASHLPPAKRSLKQVTSVKLLMMSLMAVFLVLWLTGFGMEGEREVREATNPNLAQGTKKAIEKSPACTQTVWETIETGEHTFGIS